MKTKKFLLASLFVITISLSATVALAVSTISFDPAASTAPVGGNFFVDLVWNGGVTPEYISVFNVDILYDALIVSYVGATFDPNFGVDSLGCIPGFSCNDFSGPGVIDLEEFSLDFDVIANQDSLGNMFILATLEFEALTEGHTDLLLSGLFGDEVGDPFSPDLKNGEIWIEAAGTPTIPEPTTIILFGTGILGLLGWRYREMSAGQ